MNHSPLVWFSMIEVLFHMVAERAMSFSAFINIDHLIFRQRYLPRIAKVDMLDSAKSHALVQIQVLYISKCSELHLVLSCQPQVSISTSPERLPH
jgi:hypothetical protein